MSLTSRLGLNFDTTRFGNAKNLSSTAANTLNLISNSSGGAIPGWQQNDLAQGSPVRSNYFQNPTTNYLNQISTAANTLMMVANTIGDSNTSSAVANLLIEIASFQSHTDNISGVATVTDQTYPSFQSAQNMGQLNMMTLSKSDGVNDTTPILGSYTSLFINDLLSSNANTILYFANEYANSITSVANNISGGYDYSTNIANTEVANIDSYLANTTILLMTRRTGDWSYYQNSVQLAKDVGFLSQFNNLGGTATYLVTNLVGTQRLTSNIASTIGTTVGATGIMTPGTNSSGGTVTTTGPITVLGTITTGTWQGSTVATGYGGTGLTSFTLNGAVYATSANTLTTGTLPVASGGTGTRLSTGSGSVVLNTAPLLTNVTMNGNTVVINIFSTIITSQYLTASNIVASNITASNLVILNVTSGTIVPSNTSTYNLGSASNRWANIYTSDLQLSNEAKGPNDVDGTTGNWTIQEGENDLFIINNKTGKKYKFSLEEL